MAGRKKATKRNSGERARRGPTTAEKVRTIINMMVEMRWRSNKSAEELAAKWGQTPSRVRQLAAEANRVVKGSLGDPEEWRARIVETVSLIGARSLKSKNYDAAIRSQMAIADVLGLKKTAIELTGKDGGPITVEQAAADRARIMEELAQFADQAGAASAAGPTDPEADSRTSVDVAVPGASEATGPTR